MAEQRMPGSADRRELKRFAELAGDWWDEAGPMAPLHKLNPVRLAYIRDQLCGHLGRDPKAHACLAGVSVLDVGCGGGLLCEPLARLGAAVTGHRPGAGQSRGRARARAGRRARAVVPRDRGGAAGGGRCELRSGLRHGGGRARRRRAGLPFGLRHAGAAGRRPGAGDAQSHAQIVRPRHRRGRIHPRLAAARHAPVAALPAALGGREAAARPPGSGSLT